MLAGGSSSGSLAAQGAGGLFAGTCLHEKDMPVNDLTVDVREPGVQEDQPVCC